MDRVLNGGETSMNRLLDMVTYFVEANENTVSKSE